MNEEKVLIKSRLSSTARTVFLILIPTLLILGIACLCIGIIASISHYTNTCEWYPSYSQWGYSLENLFLYPARGWIITALPSLFICLIAYIMYRCYLKCSLSVTEKNVIGRTLFGKKVNLPIYQISSYSTRTLFSQIIVSTSSGNTAFHFIENYEEIGTLLLNLINERQKDTALNTAVTTESHKPSSLDEIKTLKELLDNGIITQEEFDAKKKQLLGL